jgi:prepilin-type processing-associated H-X9-DG protein
MFEGANLAYGDAHVEWLKPHKFPIELRGGLPKNTYKPTATLVRDTTLPDLLWW